MTQPAIAADNRRAVDRHPLRTRALLVIGEHRLEVRWLDIAKGGMGIASDWNLPVGTLVVINFNLPVKHTVVPLALNAVVVNGTLAASIGGFRIGLQFRGIDPQTQLAIEQYTQR